MKKLLLITNCFPYHPGEQFLETEIKYLAQAFERIYIVPLDGDFSRRRSVPDNCEVIDDVARYIQGRLMTKLLRRAAGVPVGLSAIAYELLGENRITVASAKGFYKTTKAAATMGCAVKEVSPFIHKIQPDIIYAYWLSVEAATAAQLKNRHRLKAPIVSRAHGYDLYSYRHTPPLCPLQAFALSHVKKLFCVSTHGKQYLSRRYPHHDGKIEVSRLGVEGGGSSRPSSDGVLRIVSCSFLVPVKRVGLIAKALEFVHLPVEWTHIGDGPEKPVVQEQMRCSMEANSYLKAKLIGEMENHRVLKFYEENPVDLFINVSESEGVPVSIMEAASRGIPVLATAVGGTPEIVADQMLLDPNCSPRDVAAAITKFAQLSPAEKAKIRDRSYKSWKENFDAATNYTHFCEKLLRIAEED